MYTNKSSNKEISKALKFGNFFREDFFSGGNTFGFLGQIFTPDLELSIKMEKNT